MKQKPEETIEKYLCKQAEKLGFLCYKFTSPANNGVPDRVLIGHNTTFFVEVKAPGEKPRKLQKHVIAKINNHGGLAIVVSTKEEVDATLSTIIERSEKTSHK